MSFCVVSNGIDEGTARLVVPSGYDLEVDDSTLAGASEHGTLRVAIVVAIVLVLVALGIGFLVWFRRRRRASRPDPTIEVQQP